VSGTFAQPSGAVDNLTSRPVFIPAEKKFYYSIGESKIPVQVLQYGDVKNIVCINLHDNEGTSVQAAKSILEEKGGTLIRIDNHRQRLVRFRLKGITYNFDPNRIFSRTGIVQTLNDNRKSSEAAIVEIEKFAAALLALLPDTSTCIIALHNNTEEAYSVKSYLPGHDRQFDAKAVYENKMQDADDIAFTTDSVLYQKMADYGYNSIWQDNVHAKKDGSLSVYCGELGRRYINIETQHGRLTQYAGMFQKLLLILASAYSESGEIPVNPQ